MPVKPNPHPLHPLLLQKLGFRDLSLPFLSVFKTDNLITWFLGLLICLLSKVLAFRENLPCVFIEPH